MRATGGRLYKGNLAQVAFGHEITGYKSGAYLKTHLHIFFYTFTQIFVFLRENLCKCGKILCIFTQMLVCEGPRIPPLHNFLNTHTQNCKCPSKRHLEVEVLPQQR
jgi:hypothetical protein